MKTFYQGNCQGYQGTELHCVSVLCRMLRCCSDAIGYGPNTEMLQSRDESNALFTHGDWFRGSDAQARGAQNENMRGELNAGEKFYAVSSRIIVVATSWAGNRVQAPQPLALFWREKWWMLRHSLTRRSLVGIGGPSKKNNGRYMGQRTRH